MKTNYLLLIALGWSLQASCQTACPVGVAPGSAQCGPSPSTHVPNRSGSNAFEVAVPAPVGEWVETWGAIATDESTGDIGVAVNRLSESEARSAAIAQCTSLGSANCITAISYQNQCAVISAPTSGPGGRVIFQGAATVAVAESLAMPKCLASKPKDTCKIVYSDCTKPLFKRF